jgi:outer membrane protein assembly factor BamB
MRDSIIFATAILFLVACGSSGEDKTPPANDVVTDLDIDGASDVPAEDGGPDITADSNDTSAEVTTPVAYDYAVPLAPDSPWPKFRRNAAQNGRSPVKPSLESGQHWSFPTAKGIFSTPIIGGDGTIYVGSADRVFYALNPDGSVKWMEETGEIIDSSALLDDQGRVYWGSGDGILRARSAENGEFVWDFEADDPEVNDAFINWFEGNIAMGPDGTLYVPNDNWFIYAINRDDGSVKWKFKTPDQTWSLPAVDAATSKIYICNNNLLPNLGDNVFALDSDGKEIWTTSFIGTIAASPLLTDEGKLVFGGFDGFTHFLDSSDGTESWSFPARDHLYASIAELSDGTLIQAGADGTIYALDPENGKQIWAFDTLEPIRSSPAVDGNDNIYLGSGEGKLFVLNPDGTLRWSMQLIADDRNDLNASPALGEEAIYIAGESGEVFSIPYDYCKRTSNLGDERCFEAGETLPENGVYLYFTTSFGAPLTAMPEAIDANQILAFSLYVRKKGESVLALLDAEHLEVKVSPEIPMTVSVSGDRRFLTIIPEAPFQTDGNGQLVLQLKGDYLVDPEREGLKLTGGTTGGSFDKILPLTLTEKGPEDLALPFPNAPGDDAGVWEMSRLAAPLPTILPSYNQIGFDSLHFLIGLITGTKGTGIAWVIGARLDEETGEVVPDHNSGSLFPLTVDYQDGLLTLANTNSFALEAMNASLAFESFRLHGRLDETGNATGPFTLNVFAKCSDIAMYGMFLQMLGMCNPQTDVLLGFGAALLNRSGDGLQSLPGEPGELAFAIVDEGVEVTATDSGFPFDDHRYAVLLVDTATDTPVPLDYGLKTEQEGDDDNMFTRVLLKAKADNLPESFDAWLMVDTYPVAMEHLAK